MTLSKFDVIKYIEKYCCDYCSSYASLEDTAGKPICIDCFNKKYIKKEKLLRFYGICSSCSKTMFPRSYFSRKNNKFICRRCYYLQNSFEGGFVIENSTSE